MSECTFWVEKGTTTSELSYLKQQIGHEHKCENMCIAILHLKAKNYSIEPALKVSNLTVNYVIFGKPVLTRVPQLFSPVVFHFHLGKPFLPSP